MPARRSLTNIRPGLYQSTIWVWVTTATSLPPSVSSRVCQTWVRRPRCTGVAVAITVIPSLAPPMKLVLLSIVVVPFADVVSGVVRDQARLDPLIDEALSKGWPLKRIDAILRAVLRAGAYELEHRKDVPGRVVVSEYVDVAHAFVETEETGMVNAVLDQIARQFRGEECVRG